MEIRKNYYQELDFSLVRFLEILKSVNLTCNSHHQRYSRYNEYVENDLQLCTSMPVRTNQLYNTPTEESMRVNQLDAHSLDRDLDNQLWNLANKAFLPLNYTEEWKLLLKSLIFHFGTKQNDRKTVTYGSSLTGNYYTSTKPLLYLAEILVHYLDQKISTTIHSHPSKQIQKVYQILTRLFTFLDFTTFLQLIAGREVAFLSVWHKILGIQALQHSTSDFYRDTIYAGIQFLNRQLLWNTLLEVLSVDLITSLIQKRSTKPRNATKNDKSDKKKCVYCQEFPTNPYISDCCGSTYCYVCIVMCLEWKNCHGCGKATNFKGTPLYENRINDDKHLINNS